MLSLQPAVDKLEEFFLTLSPQGKPITCNVLFCCFCFWNYICIQLQCVRTVRYRWDAAWATKITRTVISEVIIQDINDKDYLKDTHGINHSLTWAWNPLHTIGRVVRCIRKVTEGLLHRNELILCKSTPMKNKDTQFWFSGAMITHGENHWFFVAEMWISANRSISGILRKQKPFKLAGDKPCQSNSCQ